MAVIGAEPSPDGAKIRELCGTAFPIGPNMCLTAGHVWDRVRAFPLQEGTIMDRPETGTAKLVKIEEVSRLLGPTLRERNQTAPSGSGTYFNPLKCNKLSTAIRRPGITLSMSGFSR